MDIVADLSGIAAILSAIVPAAASVLVVILQIKAGKKQKDRDEIDAVRDELRKKEEQERYDLLKREDEKIDKLAENVQKLTDTVDRISDRQDATERTVKQLTTQMHATTNILLNHQRATADVLTTVAEGFRDNKLNGNVTAAIEKYRNVETQMLSDALKTTTEMNTTKNE